MALTPKDLPNDLATLQRMLLGTMAQLDATRERSRSQGSYNTYQTRGDAQT